MRKTNNPPKQKERPLIFKAEMIRAILDGRKTQTRRIVTGYNVEHFDALGCVTEIEEHEGKAHDLVFKFVRDQERTSDDHKPYRYTGFLAWCGEYPEEGSVEITCPYGQPGDRLWCRINHYIVGAPVGLVLYGLTDDRIYCSHSINGRTNYSVEWRPTQVNSGISEQGLQGRIGRTDLLTHAICRLWQKGIRGLVSAKGTSRAERIPPYLDVSPEHQGYEVGSSFGLPGFSRDSCFVVDAGKALRWRPEQQQSEKSSLGESGGELAGQEGSRSRKRGRKTPDGETQGLGSQSVTVGDQQRADQSAKGGTSLGSFAGWHLRHHAPKLKLRPSIHMPRWASRITLEITGVRVERIQQISESDAEAEGVDPIVAKVPTHRDAFRYLWDDINGVGAWDKNPWVFVISFCRVGNAGLEHTRVSSENHLGET